MKVMGKLVFLTTLCAMQGLFAANAAVTAPCVSGSSSSSTTVSLAAMASAKSAVQHGAVQQPNPFYQLTFDAINDAIHNASTTTTNTSQSHVTMPPDLIKLLMGYVGHMSYHTEHREGDWRFLTAVHNCGLIVLHKQRSSNEADQLQLFDVRHKKVCAQASADFIKKGMTVYFSPYRAQDGTYMCLAYEKNVSDVNTFGSESTSCYYAVKLSQDLKTVVPYKKILAYIPHNTPSFHPSNRYALIGVRWYDLEDGLSGTLPSDITNFPRFLPDGRRMLAQTYSPDAQYEEVKIYSFNPAHAFRRDRYGVRISLFEFQTIDTGVRRLATGLAHPHWNMQYCPCGKTFTIVDRKNNPCAYEDNTRSGRFATLNPGHVCNPAECFNAHELVQEGPSDLLHPRSIHKMGYCALAITHHKNSGQDETAASSTLDILFPVVVPTAGASHASSSTSSSSSPASSSVLGKRNQTNAFGADGADTSQAPKKQARTDNPINE